MSKDIAYVPGPISLIFGSESPIHSHDVSHHFPSRKRSLSCAATPQQYVCHLSLLGCTFVNIKDVFHLLGKKMRRENSLQELAVCHTTPKLGNDELIQLARGLSKNSKLRVLDLSGACFDARGLASLKSYLDRNSSLEVLSLGENVNIGDEGVDIVLASLRRGNQELRVLNIEKCGIMNFGARALDLMRGILSSSLCILELSHNPIGDVGVQKLAECMVSDSCRLESLGLKNISVGDLGLLRLADALATNRTLNTLNLQNNILVTDVGASHLLKSICNFDSISSVVGSNHVLKSIELRGCNVNSSTLYTICAMSTQTVRFKVSKYFENFGCVSALGSVNSFLLPDILSFVGKRNGLDVLFRTVKSIPFLYNNSPKTESNANDSSTSFTLDDSHKAPRRLKQYQYFFNSVPLIRFTILTRNSKDRCKHERRVKKSNTNYLDKAIFSNLNCVLI
jgi:hypothetical protein